MDLMESYENEFTIHAKNGWMTDGDGEYHNPMEDGYSYRLSLEPNDIIRLTELDGKPYVPALNISVKTKKHTDTDKLPGETLMTFSRAQVLFLRNYLDAFLEATK